MAALLPELYSGWLLHNLDLVPERQQVAMFEFYKWLLILAETQYIYQERGCQVVPAGKAVP